MIKALSLVFLLSFAVHSADLESNRHLDSFDAQDISSDGLGQTMVMNLIRSGLASVEDHEVIMTVLDMPANTSVPLHTHPTEEFFYVLKGATLLQRQGSDDKLYSEGMAGKVPAKTPHSAVSGEEGVKLMVFRVHKKGEPVRTTIE